MEDKTLRDELAMSMKDDFITVRDQDATDAVSRALGIETVDIDGPIEDLIKWSFKMNAAARYAYADAMMEARAKR